MTLGGLRAEESTSLYSFRFGITGIDGVSFKSLHVLFDVTPIVNFTWFGTKLL